MRAIILSLSTVLIAGCVLPASTHDREVARRDFDQTIPGCFSERECEVKWSAARRFVLENSSMKIQHLTNDYIETFNSIRSSTGLAWRVSKEPTGASGGYRIVAQAWCDNMFSCAPDAMATMIRFNRAVSDAWRN